MSENSFHWFDYVVFSVTLLVSVGIGVFQACTGGKQKSTKEYLLGNKQMKVLPVAMSMLMSGLSGKKTIYILVGQIQSILISQCIDVKGISINNLEFKITQYADDTTLFLDGSHSSLQAALNILEIFGSISGLKVNTDKTKLIWIGKKKHCKDKLITKGLQWGCTQFDLLGLTFSVDLDSMLDLNLSAKLTEIKDLINIWNRRYLTPIGKVTVIKTFFSGQIKSSVSKSTKSK